MRILVPVKQVPNPDERVKVKKDGSGIDLEGVKMVLNPFCEIAVEEALRIKEKMGGEVVVVTVAGRDAELQVRTALAMGADRAILAEVPDEIDCAFVSSALAKIYEMESFDLVIMGKQAVDDDSNQVGQILAAKLGLPQATFVSKIAFSEDGKKAQTTREVDGGLETIEVELPAIVTTDLRLNEPRYASLPGIMKAKKKEMKVLSMADLGLIPDLKVRVVKLEPPAERAGGKKVESVEDLVDKLANEAKVL